MAAHRDALLRISHRMAVDDADGARAIAEYPGSLNVIVPSEDGFGAWTLIGTAAAMKRSLSLAAFAARPDTDWNLASATCWSPLHHVTHRGHAAWFLEHFGTHVDANVLAGPGCCRPALCEAFKPADVEALLAHGADPTLLPELRDAPWTLEPSLRAIVEKHLLWQSCLRNAWITACIACVE